METPRRSNGAVLSLTKMGNTAICTKSQPLPYRGTIIQIATRRREPTNIMLLMFSLCFCTLSVMNLRDQIKFLNHQEDLMHRVVRSMNYEPTTEMKEKKTSNERQATSLISIASSSMSVKEKKNDVVHEIPIRAEQNPVSRRTISVAADTSTKMDKNRTKSISHQERNKKKSGGALCIQNTRWYGRTFNRILEIANALAIVADSVTDANNGKETKETFIGLSPNLSVWYESFLDQREDIVLNYIGPCLSIWSPKDLFFNEKYKNSKKSRQQLQNLIPKQSYRKEAEQALASYSNRGQQQIISVHRRNLEGVCTKKAKSVSVACVKDRVLVKRSMSTNELMDTCNYDYNMIRNRHKSSIDHNKSIVVLCTDQQVPELDDTFPIRSNYSFPVEAWMMAKSDIHYGNPHSTVDLVVAVWRTGQHRRTHPEECYKEN
jgi:hypothetical protein